MKLKLKEWLLKNKIKMTEFAKQINCKKGNLSRIINGKIQPSFKVAIRIQKATNNEVQPIDFYKEEK